MKARWLSLILIGFLIWASASAFAQTGGQFCVRAFEDRDGDGTWDGGASEPLLTRDIAINLLNDDGVVVASGLLEDSPTAAQGVLCFAFLPAGQYTVIVTSAELTPTTGTSFTALVEENGQPVVFEFGAQITPAQAQVEDSQSEPVGAADNLVRIALAAGGAFLAALVMIVLGILVYSLFVRRRTPAPTGTRTARAATTGSMRAVKVESDEQDR